MTTCLLPTVPVCQFLPEPLLHWLLPQGHGAPKRGETMAQGSVPAFPWWPAGMGGEGARPGPRGPQAFQPLPPPPSFSPLCPSVHPCVLSACHPPICLSTCPRSLHSSCSSCPCPRASSGSCGQCWPRSRPCGSTCSSSPSGASCAWPGPKYGQVASPRGLAGAGSVAVLGVSQQAKGACYEGMGLHWWGADGRGP